ncbi:hypothetical protein GGU11DRAFT_514139 [Lentinula aff. detonsa]|nr:hypothetical protein GGU11DRAFT_514139 [Lentinula aff. detonsa]
MLALSTTLFRLCIVLVLQPECIQHVLIATRVQCCFKPFGNSSYDSSSTLYLCNKWNLKSYSSQIATGSPCGHSLDSTLSATFCRLVPVANLISRLS